MSSDVIESPRVRRLRVVAEAARRGAASRELEQVVVDNAIELEEAQLADSDRVAEQLLKRLRAAGRLPQE